IVLGFQVRIGNAGVPPIRTLIAHQRTIVFVLWGLMAAGLLIAVPAAILDGAFEAIPALVEPGDPRPIPAAGTVETTAAPNRAPPAGRCHGGLAAPAALARKLPIDHA